MDNTDQFFILFKMSGIEFAVRKGIHIKLDGCKEFVEISYYFSSSFEVFFNASCHSIFLVDWNKKQGGCNCWTSQKINKNKEINKKWRGDDILSK